MEAVPARCVQKGANGRVKALLKGGATAALDVKLLHNAEQNMQANPTLCQKLYAPMSQVVLKLGVIKNNLVHGNEPPRRVRRLRLLRKLESCQGTPRGGIRPS